MAYKYTYFPVENCNMCGADRSRFKVLGKRLNQSQGIRPRTKSGLTTTIIQCKNCELIFPNPQPFPEALDDHYGIRPEDYWDDNYFALDHQHYTGWINKAKTLLNHRAGLKSLDIGAGIGKLMKALSHAGFDSYVFEPSKTFYSAAIEKMEINPEKLKLIDVEHADYPHNTFDLITFDGVLEHLNNPSGAIEKALKWLNFNGIMMIEVPSSKWLVSKMINLYYRLIGTDYVTNTSPMHEPYHLYEFSLNSMKANSMIHRYNILECNYLVCSTYMPKWIDVFIKPFMRFTQTGMEMCVWLRKRQWVASTSKGA